LAVDLGQFVDELVYLVVVLRDVVLAFAALVACALALALLRRGGLPFLVRPEERALFAGLAPQLVSDKAPSELAANERPIELPAAVARNDSASAAH
jgi:hypothetical protein